MRTLLETLSYYGGRLKVRVGARRSSRYASMNCSNKSCEVFEVGVMGATRATVQSKIYSDIETRVVMPNPLGYAIWLSIKSLNPILEA